MRRLNVFIMMLFSMVLLRAEIIEKMTLKDGSVLEGYLSFQQPGKNVLFVADKSTCIIPRDKVASIVEKKVQLEALSKTWQQWAEENPSHVKKINGQSYLALSDIYMLDKTLQNLPDSLEKKHTPFWNRLMPTFRNVCITEQGKIVKFLDCSNVSYNLAWKDVDFIERIPRNKKVLNGLVDEFYLRDGKVVKGQIVKTLIGKEISVLEDNNVVRVISLSDIGWHKKTALNPKQSLLQQTSLLDVISVKNGQKVSGLIVTQNYGTEKEEGYLSVMKEDGETKRINIGEIVEMRKQLNDNYSLIIDLEVKNSELYVLRNLVTKAIIEEKDDLCLIAKKSPVLELSADTIDNKLIVEQLNTQDNQNLLLFKLRKVKVSREIRNAFTFEDLLMNGSTPKEETVSVNNTLKQVFDVREKGDYVLYRTKKREAFYLRIK